MNIQLFIPCFIDQLYPQVGFNMVKVLEKAGCAITYNENQTCCGQAAYNAGFWGEAKDVCKKFLADFDGTDYIVAPSASCVGFVRNYYQTLFATSFLQQKQVVEISNRIFEFSEFLIKILGKDDFGATLHANATYHHSCAALRECNIKNEPIQLLKKVKGLEMVEMADNETCCGFGGSFSVKMKSISEAMGNDKIDNVLATAANVLISADMSCLMHLDGLIKHRNANIQVMHLADVLACGW
jgi:L-lactate dehydrogenase complex protein LldE